MLHLTHYTVCKPGSGGCTPVPLSSHPLLGAFRSRAKLAEYTRVNWPATFARRGLDFADYSLAELCERSIYCFDVRGASRDKGPIERVRFDVKLTVGSKKVRGAFLDIVLANWSSIASVLGVVFRERNPVATFVAAARFLDGPPPGQLRRLFRVPRECDGVQPFIWSHDSKTRPPA